jgi:DNA-binding CsgD family transcriptional regulator
VVVMTAPDPPPGSSGERSPPPRQSRLGPARSTLEDTLALAAEIAASSSDVEEKVAEILNAAEPIVRVDGWMIWGLHPLTGERSRLYEKGYPAPLAAYLDGPDWEIDVVTPFAQAETGWPARVRDLPFKPSDLRCMSEFYLPVGFVEGLVTPLASVGGRLTGFLDSSVSDRRYPTDEARQLMSYLSRVLGRLIDPVEDSRRAGRMLAGEEYVLNIEPVGRRPNGEPDVRVQLARPRNLSTEQEILADFSGLVDLIVGSTGQWWATQFFWEDPLGQWYRCRCMRRHDGAVVVGVSGLERRPYGLSKRELEVMTLVADGARNDEIAARLVVTTRTVKAHVHHILEKLDVSSRSAATMKAIEEGILLRPPQSPLPAGPGVERRPLPLPRTAAVRTAGEPKRPT